MDWPEYRQRALGHLNLRIDTAINPALQYAILGLCSEAGEVADWLKKAGYHGKEIDVQKLVDECGDCLWYLNLILDIAGSNFSLAMDKNIAKLDLRHKKNNGVIDRTAEREAQDASVQDADAVQPREAHVVLDNYA